MFLKQLLHYINPLTLFKKGEEKSNVNLRMMHGINRISIFMFLFCLVMMAIKFLR
jgi:hypothetical protein